MVSATPKEIGEKNGKPYEADIIYKSITSWKHFFLGGAITFYFKEIVFMLVNMKFTNLLDQWEHEHFLISIIVVTSLESWPNWIAGTVPKWPQTRELFDIYMLF